MPEPYYPGVAFAGAVGRAGNAVGRGLVTGGAYAGGFGAGVAGVKAPPPQPYKPGAGTTYGGGQGGTLNDLISMVANQWGLSYVQAQAAIQQKATEMFGGYTDPTTGVFTPTLGGQQQQFNQDLALGGSIYASQELRRRTNAAQTAAGMAGMQNTLAQQDKAAQEQQQIATSMASQDPALQAAALNLQQVQNTNPLAAPQTMGMTYEDALNSARMKHQSELLRAQNQAAQAASQANLASTEAFGKVPLGFRVQGPTGGPPPDYLTPDEKIAGIVGPLEKSRANLRALSKANAAKGIGLYEAGSTASGNRKTGAGGGSKVGKNSAIMN